MTEPKSTAQPRDVPSGRISRAARLGGMAAGIAGNMALNGLREISRGTRPSSRDLLLTPRNVSRLTGELAKMRGAAMKVGQLLSMDSGDMIPPELAEILARLRSDADFMPPRQLRQVLDAEWGPGWLRQFQHFDVRPVAAASIGQVHKATLKTGEVLAIKVQYPGVAQSIDSDVSNLGQLMRLSGLLPAGFELAPYLAEAKTQLHQEADYAREARYLAQFGKWLASDSAFVLPQVFEPLTTSRVLTMSYLESRPIETLAALDAGARDTAMGELARLFFRELFEFGTMQTDPNFANYRYDPTTGRVVLLDFGATRALPATLQAQFSAILNAGLSDDEPAMRQAAAEMGLLPEEAAAHHCDQIMLLIEMVFAEIRSADLLDLGASRLPARLTEAGQALAADGYVPSPLPMDLVFVQRKVAGLFLLAARLGARLPARELIENHLKNAGSRDCGPDC